jgi:LytS/YehU family sensor histidine kinase
VNVAVNANARSALVPPFIAQPLVENALEHGIARRRGAGRVDISARRLDGMLELSVSDDGPGIARDAQPGVGLANVRARLRQLYGADASLALQPIGDGRGARAVVQIPFRE